MKTHLTSLPSSFPTHLWPLFMSEKNYSYMGSQVFFDDFVTLNWMYTVIACCVTVYMCVVFVDVCFFSLSLRALRVQQQRGAVRLAVTANMIRDLSALCKHGFLCSKHCASWLHASGLQRHANDSYANEHLSERLAADGWTVILSIHFWSAGISYICPPFCPPLSSLSVRLFEEGLELSSLSTTHKLLIQRENSNSKWHCFLELHS